MYFRFFQLTVFFHLTIFFHVYLSFLVQLFIFPKVNNCLDFMFAYFSVNLLLIQPKGLVSCLNVLLIYSVHQISHWCCLLKRLLQPSDLSFSELLVISTWYKLSSWDLPLVILGISSPLFCVGVPVSYFSILPTSWFAPSFWWSVVFSTLQRRNV